MGLTTNPWQMLKYIKKPVGPAIGVFCQFLIMPCITMIAIKAIDFASKFFFIFLRIIFMNFFRL